MKDKSRRDRLTEGGKARESCRREALRQALAERHSEEVQALLDQGAVAIAGLGGLGSNIAIFLARMGIGHLHLIDFDRVDMTNLNRQQYSLDHLGMYKTEAMASQLARINPWLDITTSCTRVTKENIASLFAGEDLICEAFDDPSCKALLANEVLTALPGKILVAASGMAGYGRSNAIVTRKINDRFYLCGDGRSDLGEAGGLMAPRVAICAAHQANMVLELLLKKEQKKRIEEEKF